MSFLKALPAAALLFLPPSAASVHTVSVVPASGKTEVVIGVNAAVVVRDFTLGSPNRVVIDLQGATLNMSGRTYDKVSRGGITNVRYSQFRANVVRVVVELDGVHPYEVKRGDGEVRVAISGGNVASSSWSTSRTAQYAAAPATPKRVAPPQPDVTTRPAAVITPLPEDIEEPAVEPEPEPEPVRVARRPVTPAVP